MAIGSCMALLLLIVSMEEGGPNLSANAFPLTQAIFLLSQGTGFHAGALTLTIMPLGLTALLLALTAALIRRFGPSWPAFAAGLLTWLVCTLAVQDPHGMYVVDGVVAVESKSAVVFLCAYALALAQEQGVREWVKTHIVERLPAALRASVAAGARLAFWIVATMLLEALIIVLVWIFLYHDSVARLFTLSHMGPGSRIVSSLAALAWLPNLIIWALSWACGAGFSIGDLATFTLWTGHARALPALPVFGLLPDPVANTPMRAFLLIFPALLAFILSMATLCSRKGLGLMEKLRKHGLGTLDTALIKSYAWNLLGLVVACTLSSVALGLGFLWSGGALGEHRLARVGVDTTQAIAVVARALLVGLSTSWLLFLLAAAVVLAWRNSPLRSSDTITAEPEHGNIGRDSSSPKVNSAPAKQSGTTASVGSTTANHRDPDRS
ncbi:cell division protein PerM [Bifidobacterium xylocopae]|nr:DUF6350 family protein [Bifidobacterium xylocopae]